VHIGGGEEKVSITVPAAVAAGKGATVIFIVLSAALIMTGIMWGGVVGMFPHMTTGPPMSIGVTMEEVVVVVVAAMRSEGGGMVEVSVLAKVDPLVGAPVGAAGTGRGLEHRHRPAEFQTTTTTIEGLTTTAVATMQQQAQIIIIITKGGPSILGEAAAETTTNNTTTVATSSVATPHPFEIMTVEGIIFTEEEGVRPP